MNREKVTSREYKVVLKAENFTGNEATLKKEAHAFWAKLKKIIGKNGLGFEGDLKKIDRKREIRFFDTSDYALHGLNYIFRERKNLKGNSKEVTLKFRYEDRYVSQGRNMLARKIGKGEDKFEEDIKAPFQILYSFSSTQPVDKDELFNNLKQVIRLYPGLKSYR